MKKHDMYIIVCATLIVCPCILIERNSMGSGAQAATYSVAPDGPFTTLDAAVTAARKRPANQPKRVVLQKGRYFLSEPLVLNNKDSGLTIEPAPGAKVCLYGGQDFPSKASSSILALSMFPG